jgi:lipopolysaccharide biosynthesis glycosyltransferase
MDLLILLDDQALKAHGLTHFYGSRKPWVDKITSGDKSAHIYWHQIRSTLELPMRPLSKFKLPLTDVGHKRYLQERVLYDYYAEEPEFEIEIPGVISVSTNICNLSEPERAQFAKGVEDSIDSKIS